MGRRQRCISDGLPTTRDLYNRFYKMPNFGRNRPGFPYFTRMANTYFWAALYSINGHYMAIVTVCLVVLLSFILPDISHKMHRKTELKSMKKLLDMMTIHSTTHLRHHTQKDVSRAEVACLTVADKIGFLQRSMHDHTTETFKNQQDLAICTSESMRATQSAPVQVEKKRGFLRRMFFPNRNASNKEIAIMSYVYTDSFDAAKKIKEVDK